MNGRTYCGHYKGYYLKSTLEYIYARYLDYTGTDWDYEVQTFELSTGGSYKPDFYLIKEGRYVEIKGGFNYKTDLPRIKVFEADHQISVQVFQEHDLRKLIRSTPFVFEQLKREWKQIAQGLGMDTSGENNPRYGVKQSALTRLKIAKKAKARLQNPEYRKKWNASRRSSEKVKRNIEQLKQYNDQRYYQVFGTCQHCSKRYEVTYRKNNPPRYCSRKCSVSDVRGKTSPEVSQAIQLLALEFSKRNSEAILKCKLNKIRPLLQPFYEQVSSLYDIQDERTLSKALLGRQTGRKEVLTYFRNLVEKVLGTMGK
ncbi:MAG: hypothetical protein WBB01_02430 [Phormidesmis sp.]